MSALKFNLLKRCSRTGARASEMVLPHGMVATPVFMPVGTQGTMKGLTPAQLAALDCQIMLSNTYHLGLRPGPEVLKQAGGLHKFMAWPRSVLTDSGGFQMVSLLTLSEVTEEGVKFRSPHDGQETLLTPEYSIQLQNVIGADIMMQLDDVVSSKLTGPRVEEAMHRSIRWLDRCIAAHERPTEQNLFAIIQGGLDTRLREICVAEMVKRDLPGYAIGGLSGGESKDLFWRIVSFTAKLLPDNKPRYCMGVGYAVDLIVCVALGVDMFDCVYPTRTARFGRALIHGGTLDLCSTEYARDCRPIDADCPCPTCKNHTRAHLHCLAANNELGCILLTVHNIAYQLNLMRKARQSILDDRFPEFVQNFMLAYYPSKKYPNWAQEAFASVGIELIPAEGASASDVDRPAAATTVEAASSSAVAL